MIPGEVIGRLVPNQVVASLRGVRFLVVQPIDEVGAARGEAVVACDGIGASIGDRVYIAQGREATFPLPEPFNPADMTAIAIVDAITNDD